jgi:glycosyltransferase involved in cell wall biosynthesis
LRILHLAKKENSGLFMTMMEMCKYEEILGHQVIIKEPQGNSIYGKPDGSPDIIVIHSQMDMSMYHACIEQYGIETTIPVIMIMHGEILSSVGNGISMKAILDLAPLVDCFVCFRKEEQSGWNSIRRTFYCPKGVDLDVFHPLPTTEVERLSGNPSILYYESWRGSRNPIILCKAMELVWKKYPEARLHLYNCNDKRMLETFQAYIKHTKSWIYIRSLNGPVAYKDVPSLINKVDCVASCLAPLYARTPIEALACGKACVAPGYPGDPENPYPWTCTLNAESMADAIIRCHENYDSVDYRAHAQRFHDVRETMRQVISIYEGYLNLGRSTGMSLVRAS